MVWRRDSHFTHCPRLSSDLCCCGNKFVAVPDGLELLRNGELRLRVRERNVWLLHKVWKKLNSKNINKRISARVLNVFSAHSWKDTYKLSVFVGYQDVHLRALGADDLTVQRIVAQVDMATIGLVDGDGGHFTHDLKKSNKMSNLPVNTRRLLITMLRFISAASDGSIEFQWSCSVAKNWAACIVQLHEYETGCS